MNTKDLTVITSHLDADYDAIASLLAAQKLYPGAVVVFPGTHEKNHRDFILVTMGYLFNMTTVKDIDFNRVKQLVIVDVKQARRIGKLAELLQTNDLEVHIYDHHPAKPDDIRGQLEVVRPAGATVSILISILQEKKIALAPDEATVMYAGIYTDTTSFTSMNTTPEDFKAAAYLVENGADLGIVNSLIPREISPEQISLLNDMLQAAASITIRGVELVITTISTEDYVNNFAVLVEKMVKMENLSALIGLARMGNKIYVTGRSRNQDVDMSLIMGKLGGGGHSAAASATIRGKTLAQAETELLKILNKIIRSSKRALDLMSAPAAKVMADISCAESKHFFTKYNVNTLLVITIEDGLEKLLGFISRQVIEKVIYLKLDQALVCEYMTTELEVVPLSANLPEIQSIIIDQKQRVLPVIKSSIIQGVITRTDLLNTLANMNYSSPSIQKWNSRRMRSKNILWLMRERLSSNIIQTLETIGKAATKMNYGVYIVGGFVRDLFLRRKNEDLDIVIEGDGINFACCFAKSQGARVHTHAKFNTAVIIYPDDFKIDVASARTEHYLFPGAMPDVEMSSIKLDLYRRDFTINTMAVQLNQDKFGNLIDFFSAQRDLKSKAIRILHNLSFVEDPTRVFRAVRFEQRFGFTIGKLTDGLIKNAVKLNLFDQLYGHRLLSELRLIFEEENPTPVIQRLNDYGLLKAIHPDIRANKRFFNLFQSATEVLAWYDLNFMDEACQHWLVYAMVLLTQLDSRRTQEFCQKIKLPARRQILFCHERFEAVQTLSWLKNEPDLANSKIYKRLTDFDIEIILYMMAATPSEKIKKKISYYCTRLRGIKTSIRGQDLKIMGLSPGPVYRQILNKVLDAKLDGKVKSHAEELIYARNFILTI